MKLISKSEALEVYRPENYAPCRQWGIREWAIALENRYKLRQYHQERTTPQNYRLPAHQLVNLEDRARALFDCPMGKESTVSAYFAGHSPVRDQSVEEYFFAVDDWDDPEYAEWVERVNLSSTFGLDSAVVFDGSVNTELTNEIHSEIIKLYETPAWKLWQSDAISHRGFLIAVDLKASDESLKRSFATWLGRVRVASGAKAVGKVFSDKEAHVWVNQYYLPYLDLTFWSKLQGRRISDEVMTDVLYPSHLRPSIDRIRTAFKAKAEKIVSKQFVDALRLQLSEDQSFSA